VAVTSGEDETAIAVAAAEACPVFAEAIWIVPMEAAAPGFGMPSVTSPEPCPWAGLFRNFAGSARNFSRQPAQLK
jgi:hypothetical protein